MYNHGQNHRWVTHTHLRRVTSLISFNPHPSSPPSGFSLYSSCASLPLLIPSQLSPPAHLTSNHLWSEPGPTGTRRICTNTHSYLSNWEKQHSKTKKKGICILPPGFSHLDSDHNLFAQMKREEEFFLQSYEQCLWAGLERNCSDCLSRGFWTTEPDTDDESYYLCFVWDCNRTDEEQMDRLWIYISKHDTELQVCLRWLCCRRLQIMMR